MPKGKRDETRQYFGESRKAKLRELWPTYTSAEEILEELKKLPGLPHIPLHRLAQTARNIGVSRPEGYRAFVGAVNKRESIAQTFIGKPCIRCGETIRYVSSRGCKACDLRRGQLYLKNNPDKQDAYDEARRRREISHLDKSPKPLESPPEIVRKRSPRKSRDSSDRGADVQRP